MKRLAFLPLLPLGLLALAPARLPKIATYRDIGCGCCEGWALCWRSLEVGFGVGVGKVREREETAQHKELL